MLQRFMEPLQLEGRGVIGTGATMMVTTGRAAITAGRCPFRKLECGNYGDQGSISVSGFLAKVR